MGLLASWRESLDILRLKNLKTFTLLTLNAWWQAWKICWLPILVLYLLGSVVNYLVGPIVISNTTYYGLVGALVKTIVVTIFLIGSRPSIKQKNSSYMFSMLRDYLVPIFLVGLLVGYLINQDFVGLVTMGKVQSRGPGFWTFINSIVQGILFYHYGMYDIFFQLFYLDTRPWNLWALLNSLRNGIVFLLYNLPLIWFGTLVQMAVMIIPALAIESVWYFLMDQCPSLELAHSMAFFVLLSLLVTFWVNVYIKRVRDNPSLYV